MTTPLNLADRLPSGPIDRDSLLEIFIDWTLDQGLEMYPAQEEAVLEVFADRHVILNTPTGSGKSLVGLAMHFLGYATGSRSVYTSPIKALVSEKFFSLCKHFGAKNVGMLTGDSSINAKASIICCTAEILSAMALTEGRAASVHYAVIDEFHYYGDRDRGMAWQIPLLALPDTRFLLMSATLGDTRQISTQLHERSGREVTLVRSDQRPVPLDFSYVVTPLMETVTELVEADKAPIYLVCFTQRDCAETVQSLTSLNFSSKEEKKRIAAELVGTRFDTPYGKDVQKYLRHGLGIHHAGLLPKYRLLVEQLAQKGLLKIIVGTDTLGVGINVPLRSVLFTKLCKYDGVKTRILSVRDFKQIAGRAGRKGFDDHGYVVCQAPAHVIENIKAERKAAAKGRKKVSKRKPPERGYVHWDEETFQRLISDDSEALKSRFKVDHGVVLNLLQRADQPKRGGYGLLIELIAQSHERDSGKRRLRRRSKQVFRQLLDAGVVQLQPVRPKGQKALVDETLQRDFSLHHSLSLFLLDALAQLDTEAENYPQLVLTFVEAILEDPHAVLRQQQSKLKGDKVAELKAEGVEYDQRMEALEKITWPMPDADRVLAAFDTYARKAPWTRIDDIRPKSVVRDMHERYATFSEYVRAYGLSRSEGVLLRHISQVYKALIQAVPESLRTEALVDVIAYVRVVLQGADSSLITAWEAMMGRDAAPEAEALPEAPRPIDISRDKRTFYARIRAEMHQLLQALSRGNFEAAAAGLRPGETPWTAEDLSEGLAPFLAEHGRLVFDHNARRHALTLITDAGARIWTVRQVLQDPEGENMHYVDGRIDLREAPDPGAPLVALVGFGS